MKKLLAILMAVLLSAALLAGCAADGGQSLSGWDYVKDNGKLIIGLDDTFAPMGFRDESGSLVGFDIDLANEVAQVLDIEIEFKPIDWNSKEVELSSKRIDCIWNGMSATPARQGEMALTKKYLNNRLVIMAINPDVSIAGVEDLKNYNIGTQADSSALEAMQTYEDSDGNKVFDSFKDMLKEYGTYDEVILDMQAGRIDCMVVDEVLGEYKNSKLTEKMIICDFNFGDDFYAIGCRKGETDLADKISGAIKTLIDNGTAKTISEKWFGVNIVILEDY